MSSRIRLGVNIDHVATLRNARGGSRPDPVRAALAAIAAGADALTGGGVLAVWSEEPDLPFEDRLRAQGLVVERHRVGGGRAHTVYLARR